MVRSALESSETRLFAKFNVSAAVASASVIVSTSRALAKVFIARALAASPEKPAEISRRVRDVPWTSTILDEMQQERKTTLLNLVDPHHMLTCRQFAYDQSKSTAFMLRKPSPVEKRQLTSGCQMPLSKSATCSDCTLTFFNCPLHMLQCGALVWGHCANKECLRLLCQDHLLVCYCETKSPGHIARTTKPVVPTAVAALPTATFPSPSESALHTAR